MPQVIEPDDSRFEAPYLADFKAFIQLKRQLDDLKKSQDIIKTRLMDLVERFGDEDDKGHFWFDLPSEVDGYVGMQRQKRISQNLDMNAAEDVLDSAGLRDRCIEMVPSVNEDEVMACLYEGLLSENDIDRMYPKKITWAFVPVKK